MEKKDIINQLELLVEDSEALKLTLSVIQDSDYNKRLAAGEVSSLLNMPIEKVIAIKENLEDILSTLKEEN